MTDHTPGEWTFDPDQQGFYDIHGPVAVNLAGEDDVLVVRNIGDAHLIAAAPGLVDMLEKSNIVITELLNQDRLRHINDREKPKLWVLLEGTIKANKSIISRAKGQTP